MLGTAAGLTTGRDRKYAEIRHSGAVDGEGHRPQDTRTLPAQRPATESSGEDETMLQCYVLASVFTKYFRNISIKK